MLFKATDSLRKSCGHISTECSWIASLQTNFKVHLVQTQTELDR